MSENVPNNPYQVPEANLVKSKSTRFSVTPRAVPAGNGLRWITEGWSLFSQAPLQMILMILIYLGLTMLIALIPGINILSPLIIMVILGGMFTAIHRLDQDGKLLLEDIFSAFKTHLGPLLLLGLLQVVFMLLFVGAAFLLGFSTVLGSGGGDSTTGLLFLMILIPVFVVLAIALGFAMLYAAQLIVLNDQPIGSAISNAFSAFFKNILPFLVNGILAILITLIAIIPFGLGLFVSAPVLFLSLYASFRDIFAAE